MITSFLLALGTICSAPLGVEFESRSWPAKADTDVMITIVAADGAVNDGATLHLQKMNDDAGGVQDGLFALLEQDGWDVRRGPNDTVLVFAPKGQWVRSVVVTSDGWRPGYRYVLGPPPKGKP